MSGNKPETNGPTEEVQLQQIQPNVQAQGHMQHGYGPPHQYPGQSPQQYPGQPPQQYPGQPPQQYPGQPPQQYPGQPPQPYGQYGMQPPPGQYPMMAQPGVPGAPQPAPAQWMPAPQAPIGCPPGLEYLTHIDQLLVHQQIELFEVFTNWETQNRYIVKNTMGQQVYYAHEESDTCMRQCCGPQRGFTMHITDNMQQEVIRVIREFKCCAGCAWCASSDCCAMEVAVEAPVGTVVGYVKQTGSVWPPHFDIKDADGNTVFKIRGPCCICQGVCCQWDQEFLVHNNDLTSEVGKISKQWSGLLREMYTNADNFGVSFPQDLDVKLKATMLGAVFLIDFMYFEQNQNKNN
ncbi:phospholipid scramblase 2-like [Glandiceps talaboti]